MGVPVYHASEGQTVWSGGHNLEPPNGGRAGVQRRDDPSSHRRSCWILWVYGYGAPTQALSITRPDRNDSAGVRIGLYNDRAAFALQHQPKFHFAFEGMGHLEMA